MTYHYERDVPERDHQQMERVVAHFRTAQLVVGDEAYVVSGEAALISREFGRDQVSLEPVTLDAPHMPCRVRRKRGRLPSNVTIRTYPAVRTSQRPHTAAPDPSN